MDARGRSCPEPVLLTKKAVSQHPEGVQVMVDNTTARDNIKRFAGSQGYSVQVKQDGENFVLTLSR